MRNYLLRGTMLIFAVSLVICSCTIKTVAEETGDVRLSFGTWVQTEGVYTVSLEITGEWSAILLEISLPEGCKITDVSVWDGGRAAASAFLAVKHRAAVALTSPEPPSAEKNTTLLIRFTAKGGAKGELVARGATGEPPAFCAIAARPDGDGAEVREGRRELELADGGQVEYLGTQSGKRGDGSQFTRVLFNLIYIGDERRLPTVYVLRGSGVVRLTVTEIKTSRGAILAYTFDGLKEDEEYEIIVES